MVFRTGNLETRRKKQETPHRVLVLYKRLVGDHGDLVVICQRVMRQWRSGLGYVYNVGDGVWRAAYEVMY